MTTDRWERFYEERDYDRCAYLDGEAMIEYGTAFFERVGVPDSFASVGCGPAVTEFELAERFPEMTVVCFDVAARVVEDNRTLARERGIENISFEVESLPDVDLGRSFDVVYCVATLFFVADVETAIERLYDHVAPGGYLIVNYPTRALQDWVREQDDEKRAFFELVEAGENLTTADAIGRLLGTTVQDYGEAVDAGEELAATVFVQKEQD